MRHFDSLHSLYIGDTSLDPLAEKLPSRSELLQAYQSMIISASGWRKVFAESGDEQDPSPAVSLTDQFLTALATQAFSTYLKDASKEILVGVDARPTGQTLGSIAVRILTALGHRVRYLFITAAPEIMAASFQEGCDGFFYISASHNPIGHNGFKMGRDGGVFSADDAEKVAAIFASLIQSAPTSLTKVQELSASLSKATYQTIFSRVDSERKIAQKQYREFALRTAVGSTNEKEHMRYLQESAAMLRERPLGIVGEINGSARSTTIDEGLLRDLGVRLALYNNRPYEVVHEIVPEGENLDLCRSLLEQHYREDPAYLIGYSVDNDGDRGNIVYIDERDGRAKILDAQSVFALSLLSEFAQSRLHAADLQLATAVNGPTSMRVDQIAARFGASVYRAEVGEANVVTLAESIRATGILVPILGEGSNGGNITYPARVRDPLNTLITLIQLLRNKAIAALWFSLLERPLPPNYSVADIIESLPKAITTETVSPDALMQVQSDHGRLKSRYEDLFVAQWPEQQSVLNRWGITAYVVHQMEGPETREGLGPAYRTPPYTGGFKVLLLDSKREPQAFLWMRGSQTEPVYRLMVDVLEDNKELYQYLLSWHRSLIERADREA